MTMSRYRITLTVTVDVEAQDKSHATDIAIEDVRDAVDSWADLVEQVVDVTPSIEYVNPVEALLRQANEFGLVTIVGRTNDHANSFVAAYVGDETQAFVDALNKVADGWEETSQASAG